MKNFTVNEHCSWILSQGSPHNCIIAAGLRGDVDFLRLQESVSKAAREHEILQFSIAKNICSFVVANTPAPVIEIFNDCGWQQIAENELATPFIEYAALARITLLKSKNIQYIILCFHHVIGDAASGIYFLKRIIEHYNNTNLFVASMDENNDNHFLLPSPQSKISTLQAHTPNTTTKLNGIEISVQIIRKLEKRAKNAGYSMNTCLSDSILQAAAKIFNAKNFDVSMPVSLRNKHNAMSALKFHTSWINLEWSHSKSQNKENRIKKLHSQIHTALTEKQYINNLHKLNKLIEQSENHFDFSQSFIAKQPTICISNLGVIDIQNTKDNHPLKIIDIHVAVNAQAYMGTAESFTIQLSQIADRGLFINMCYPSPLITKEKSSLFLKQLESLLK